jgi:hypothetical protein
MATATNGAHKSRWSAGVTPYAEMGYLTACGSKYRLLCLARHLHDHACALAGLADQV